ncbi:hypothetical protein ACTL32_10475 [Planococcus sp. FY231025]|uniref:hypothetical protein n=1 Tax=Planococcus sp. FY231025 TaxID=3455699 RepID=UPI003F9306E7
MSLPVPEGVAEVEMDGYELTISISSDFELKAEDHPYLKEIISYAVEQGYTRFAGASRGEFKKGIKTFFFSKPGYFDKDDMLIADFEIKGEVNKIMQEEFNL